MSSEQGLKRLALRNMGLQPVVLYTLSQGLRDNQVEALELLRVVVPDTEGMADGEIMINKEQDLILALAGNPMLEKLDLHWNKGSDQRRRALHSLLDSGNYKKLFLMYVSIASAYNVAGAITVRD
jgi:hypothetical protein